MMHELALGPMQSAPITANVVNSNPDHGEVCSIQDSAIKFVNDCDLGQIGAFLWVLRFPPPIKLTASI
jgi:hypothetical protein